MKEPYRKSQDLLSSPIPEGKLSIEQLRESVLGHIQTVREEVIEPAQIGRDSALVQIEKGLLAITSDPITGTSHHIGRMAVRINLNDLAAAGADPLAIMITLLMPPGTTASDISQIMREASHICALHRVQIIGGHTEVTSAVNRPIVSITAFGYVNQKISSAQRLPAAGDDIWITKTVGLEGTLILASNDSQNFLRLYPDQKEQAASYDALLDVTRDSQAARQAGVYAMHDITEGGLLGAIYETLEPLGLGAHIQPAPSCVSALTALICERLSIDPLRLISSGSMLLYASPERREALQKSFQAAGIALSLVGHVQTKPEMRIKRADGTDQKIDPPSSDALYQGIEKLEANSPKDY